MVDESSQMRTSTGGANNVFLGHGYWMGDHRGIRRRNHVLPHVIKPIPIDRQELTNYIAPNSPYNRGPKVETKKKKGLF